MTQFQLLTEGTRTLEQAGSPDAQIDAQQLLLAAFHLDTVHFLLNRLQELKDNEDNRSAIGTYRDMIARRAGRCPLQQILGAQEFMGLDFYVNEHVLIPRQDTETLVELVLEEQCKGNAGKRLSLLDLCTGSGCIAVSLAVKGSFSQVTATDISEEALKVAKRNREALLESGPDGAPVQFEFYQGDLFEALPKDGRRYDVITSNPPYIPTAVIRTLEPEVRDHEPILALDGTADGVYYYRRIADQAKNYLTQGGALYLEIGYDQGELVSRLLEEQGFGQVRVCRDLAGKDRVVCARCPE